MHWDHLASDKQNQPGAVDTAKGGRLLSGGNPQIAKERWRTLRCRSFYIAAMPGWKSARSASVNTGTRYRDAQHLAKPQKAVGK